MPEESTWNVCSVMERWTACYDASAEEINKIEQMLGIMRRYCETR
jgi:hypothetical protein